MESCRSQRNQALDDSIVEESRTRKSRTEQTKYLRSMHFDFPKQQTKSVKILK